MSSIDRSGSRVDARLQKLKAQSAERNSSQVRRCTACNKEFSIDEYLDHVYDNDECYRAYLASEKKEMSKQ